MPDFCRDGAGGAVTGVQGSVDDGQAVGAGPQDDEADNHIGQGLHNADFLEETGRLPGGGAGRHAEGEEDGGDLLEQRVPRDLWHVYVEGCSALADALGRSFSGMLERAGIDPRTIAGGDSDRPAERLGFQEPRQHESEDSGEQHGNPDRH